MATLPNLNLTDIEIVGTWDVGVNIEATERDAMVAKLATFTEYDNGFDGTMWVDRQGNITTATDDSATRIQVRMRSDGLLYAWSLRADEPSHTTWDGVAQQYTSMSEPATYRLDGASNMTRGHMAVLDGSHNLVTDATRLSMALLRLEEEVTDAGKTAFTHSGVDYHDPVNTTADALYISWEQQTSNGSNETSSGATTSAPAGTTVHSLSAWLWIPDQGGAAPRGHVEYQADEHTDAGDDPTLLSRAAPEPFQWSCRLALGEVDIPGSDDQWDFFADNNSSTGNGDIYAVAVYVVTEA